MSSEILINLPITDKYCRICYEKTDSSNNKLISPCSCTGTSKYIHIDCLQKWRYNNPEFSEPRIKCMECNSSYIIEKIQYPTPFYIKYINHFLTLYNIFILIIIIIYEIYFKNIYFIDYYYRLNKDLLISGEVICHTIIIVILYIINISITYLLYRNMRKNIKKNIYIQYICDNTLFLLISWLFLLINFQIILYFYIFYNLSNMTKNLEILKNIYDDEYIEKIIEFKPINLKSRYNLKQNYIDNFESGSIDIENSENELREINTKSNETDSNLSDQIIIKEDYISDYESEINNNLNIIIHK